MDSKLQSMFIASRKGRIYHYDPKIEGVLSLAFEDNDNPEIMMGLEKKGKSLYAAGKSKIFRFEIDKGKLIPKIAFRDQHNPAFHQMFIVDDCLYVVATRCNSIWVFDLNLNLIEKYDIDPPDKTSPVNFTKNYNHLNSIFYYKERFYVDLNWFTQKHYGSSGVAILDNEMKEIRRFEHGWESHNYIILNDQSYVLCATSMKIEEIKLPYKGGLMVDGKNRM